MKHYIEFKYNVIGKNTLKNCTWSNTILEPWNTLKTPCNIRQTHPVDTNLLRQQETDLRRLAG